MAVVPAVLILTISIPSRRFSTVERLAHTVFLGENLSDFGSLCVALVDLNGDAVWGQVFHGDEDTLGTVDDEVASWVQVGLRPSFAKQVRPSYAVSSVRGGWVQVTRSPAMCPACRLHRSRADHDWHAADLRLPASVGDRYAVSAN